MSLPTFAVVGHPNKGKSSIVATLAEDDRVAISPTPGTTRHAHRYTLVVDGEPRYILVDTPGFQRPGELLAWLRKRAPSASDRAQAVAEFVLEQANNERFHDEIELLRPLLDGAGILYVVDGSKPYGPEYELEMEVLRWTGRPRMALINKIGEGNYENAWREALGQYFSIVRVFDALHADFDKRISLLRAFAELDEAWRVPLEQAVAALQADRARRRERSAREIAAELVECLTCTEEGNVSVEGDTTRLKSRLGEKLRERIRRREQEMMTRVQAIYRHDSLPREDSAIRIQDSDVFTRENWEVFGLSRQQLVVTGALSGAAAGGGIDLALGGASMLLGASLGAVIGGASAWLGGQELAKVKTLTGSLGGKVVRIGPVSAPNFPWVLIGRAWVHHSLIAERNHAHREALAMNVADDQNLMNSVPDSLRRELARSFKQLQAGSTGDEVFEALYIRVLELLALLPAGSQSRTPV
ncbi:MAG: GTPase/DUF3482 domain-containing protein [Pseudomonadales bacterium]|nr:GTPase/DUF3482 domain-containing protein [Pseudomonadales bacterium]